MSDRGLYSTNKCSILFYLLDYVQIFPMYIMYIIEDSIEKS